jgi:hypothetical protein
MYILAYWLKTGTVEPERQPLLASGSEKKTFVSRQRRKTDNRTTSVAWNKILNKQK